MKVLIADDEPIARQVLRELLEECPGVAVAGEAASGAEALRQVERLNPDVVLLDIHMPQADGLAVARRLRPEPLPLIIYVTAYEQHAVAAFETGAVDYLLKPVRLERLRAALDRARARLEALQAAQAARIEPPQRIAARLGEEIHLVDTRDVILFRAVDGGVEIIATSGRYRASHPLRELERRFPPPQFRRIHRAILVNTAHLRSISPLSSRRYLLRLTGGIEAVVSKRMAGIIREAAQW
ncbi:MAG: LytTR family DNA-binding domain-containing protein [Bryobacteraceae bacterium]|nr:LytTR family DNA-binding domain-containing protein [Bryobacteraceae bacterium]MCX7605336.1 LytTR family DNA-binding domain-containing protein [Bryobacteraceae bacterium]